METWSMGARIEGRGQGWETWSMGARALLHIAISPYPLPYALSYIILEGQVLMIDYGMGWSREQI